MTYGFVVDVPAPIEFYDALHAEATRRGRGSDHGMLLHAGRATPGGFQVLEVWESREHREFEPRGLIVPSAQVAG